MVIFQDWLSFALLTFTFCLIPGPSVGFTVAYALENGTWKAAASVAGQVSSNGIYILAVSFGLERLLGQAPGLFTVLKMGGVAYLTYLGVTGWRASGSQAGSDAGECVATRGALSGFGRGFLVCGTNPKTFLYYAAILPPFISPHGDRALQLAILGATAMAVGGGVLLLYALMAARVRDWFIGTSRLHLRKRIAGTLMIGAAVYLALGR